MAEKAKEKTMKVRFTNIEFPSADVSFTYNNQKHHLFDGEKYDLPVDTVKHLNDLRIPESRWETDPDSGQVVSKSVLRNRFVCVPV